MGACAVSGSGFRDQGWDYKRVNGCTTHGFSSVSADDGRGRESEGMGRGRRGAGRREGGRVGGGGLCVRGNLVDFVSSTNDSSLSEGILSHKKSLPRTPP